MSRQPISRHAICAVAGALLTVAAAGTSHARGVIVESHTIQQNLFNMAWGQQDVAHLGVPLFDSMGGTRELQEIRFAYAYSNDYTITWDASPHDAPSGARVTWSNFHRFGPFFDILGFGEDEGFVGGHMGFRPPQAPAEELVYTNFGVSFGYEGGNPFFEAAVQVVDPAHISLFLGAGLTSWESVWAAGELSYSPLPPFPPSPPGTIYTPELLHASSQRIGFELTVFYAYTEVPAPGVAATVVCGLAALGRRRSRSA